MNEMIDIFTVIITTMSLQKIHFTDAILEETAFLLPDVAKLIISANNANDKPVINLNNVSTILLYQPVTGTAVSEATITAMQKMAQALQLSQESYCILNLADYPGLKLYNLTANPSVSKLICLGVEPESIGLWVDFIYYKQFKFNNLDILISHNMEGITADHKKILWGKLQIMFNLK